MSAIHLSNSDQQRDEWRTQVQDALIHDQNVYRLNMHTNFFNRSNSNSSSSSSTNTMQCRTACLQKLSFSMTLPLSQMVTRNTLDCDQSDAYSSRNFLIYFSKSAVSFFLFITQVDYLPSLAK